MFNFFKKKNQTVVTAPVVEKPRELAKIIPLKNPNQEYEDLNEKHSDFFNNPSPVIQMQSKIGKNNFSNIEDVTLSRSNTLFSNAPEITDDPNQQFEELEQYMNIPILEEVEEDE